MANQISSLPENVIYFTTDDGDLSHDSRILGLLNGHIYGLRYTLTLDPGASIKQFSFTIGNNNLYLLKEDYIVNNVVQADTVKAAFDDLCANKRFRGIITSDPYSFIRDTAWGPICDGAKLTALKNATNYFTLDVAYQSSSWDSNKRCYNYFYSINGTTNDNQILNGGSTYYLWIYAFPIIGWGRLSNGFGGSSTSALNDLSFNNIKYQGLAHIYTDQGWKDAIPYVYNGSEWKQAIPYVYNGSTWKNTC